MGWVEYVSKTKLGVTDNTIVHSMPNDMKQ